MKLVKSLLLGSAAGLVAASGVMAADLPTRKAAPVDYVRICSLYGPGFFYIPGTDTCIKIGGKVRFEMHWAEPRGHGDSTFGTNSQLDIKVDTRTQTDWGLLRTYFDFVARRRSGAWFGSGTATRMGNAETFQGTVGSFPSYSAIDVAGNKLESSAYVGQAFVQFGGLTAGRVQSFFDFYADNDNIIGTLDSDSTADLVAYTYAFGNGFSATLSAEDGIERRQPIAGLGAFGAGGPIFPSSVSGGFAPAFANYLITYPSAALGPAFWTGANTSQRQAFPDVIANIRVDQAWGSAQLSGAWHHISTSGSTIATTALTPGAAVSSVAGGFGGLTENGYAIRGGVKINLPMIAAGDTLTAEGGWAKGAMQFVNSGYPGQQSAFGNYGYGSAGGIASYDAILNPAGKLTLPTAWSATVSFLHYWTPSLRSAFFGSYFSESFGNKIRKAAGYAEGAACPGCVGTIVTPTGALYNPFSPYYMDGRMWQVGANIVWSPVKNMDIGVEVIYTASQNGHKAYDTNKGYPFLSSSDGQFMSRVRIQRDF